MSYARRIPEFVTRIQPSKPFALFEAWYEQEMPRLYRYLCYRTRDKELAEEVTASTCEKALQKLSQYNPARGEFRSWLFGIAQNEIRLYFRSLNKQPAQVSFDSLPDIRISSASPEQEYQKKETFSQILLLLATFPESEQDVIALRYGAGLTNEEIALVTGLTTNHVAVLIHRALKKLRQVVEEASYEGL